MMIMLKLCQDSVAKSADKSPFGETRNEHFPIQLFYTDMSLIFSYTV
jgi:hypothetical protein